MKPISGSVLSSKAVTLKKAATILSRFVASDTGAQQDVLGFLKRTSEAATELVQFYNYLLFSERDSGAEILETEEKTTEKEEEKKKKKKKRKKERKDEEAMEADRDQIRASENGGAVDFVDLKVEKHRRRDKSRLSDETEGLRVKSVEVAGNESVATDERKSKRKKKKKRKDEGDGKELTPDVNEARAKKRKLGSAS